MKPGRGRAVEQEPTTGSSAPAPSPTGGHADKKDQDHWTLLQKLLALLTAVLTLATAAVGLWGAQAKSERDDLQERSDGLVSELETAVDERDLAVGDLERAEARIAELEASAPVATTTSTSLGGPAEGDATYLADLDLVDGSWYRDRDLQIDGVAYLEGIRSTGIHACNNNIDAVEDVEYSIDRAYTTLTAVVGLSDESMSGLPVEIEITGDGRALWTQSVEVGRPQPVTLDVTGILRLKVTATKQFDESSGCPNVYAALGDPALE